MLGARHLGRSGDQTSVIARHLEPGRAAARRAPRSAPCRRAPRRYRAGAARAPIRGTHGRCTAAASCSLRRVVRHHVLGVLQPREARTAGRRDRGQTHALDGVDGAHRHDASPCPASVAWAGLEPQQVQPFGLDQRDIERARGQTRGRVVFVGAALRGAAGESRRPCPPAPQPLSTLRGGRANAGSSLQLAALEQLPAQIGVLQRLAAQQR